MNKTGAHDADNDLGSDLAGVRSWRDALVLHYAEVSRAASSIFLLPFRQAQRRQRATRPGNEPMRNVSTRTRSPGRRTRRFSAGRTWAARRSNSPPWQRHSGRACY